MHLARSICLLFSFLAVASPAQASVTAGPGAPVELRFYAAASLRDVLRELTPALERATGTTLVWNLGASSDLARQIVAAGKADLFFSADEGCLLYTSPSPRD